MFQQRASDVQLRRGTCRAERHGEVEPLGSNKEAFRRECGSDGACGHVVTEGHLRRTASRRGLLRDSCCGARTEQRQHGRSNARNL